MTVPIKDASQTSKPSGTEPTGSLLNKEGSVEQSTNIQQFINSSLGAKDQRTAIGLVSSSLSGDRRMHQSSSPAYTATQEEVRNCSPHITFGNLLSNIQNAETMKNSQSNTNTPLSEGLNREREQLLQSLLLRQAWIAQQNSQNLPGLGTLNTLRPFSNILPMYPNLTQATSNNNAINQNNSNVNTQQQLLNLLQVLSFQQKSNMGTIQVLNNLLNPISSVPNLLPGNRETNNLQTQLQQHQELQKLLLSRTNVDSLMSQNEHSSVSKPSPSTKIENTKECENRSKISSESEYTTVEEIFLFGCICECFFQTGSIPSYSSDDNTWKVIKEYYDIASQRYCKEAPDYKVVERSISSLIAQYKRISEKVKAFAKVLVEPNKNIYTFQTFFHTWDALYNKDNKLININYSNDIAGAVRVLTNELPTVASNFGKKSAGDGAKFSLTEEVLLVTAVVQFCLSNQMFDGAGIASLDTEKNWHQIKLLFDHLFCQLCAQFHIPLDNATLAYTKSAQALFMRFSQFKAGLISVTEKNMKFYYQVYKATAVNINSHSFMKLVSLNNGADSKLNLDLEKYMRTIGVATGAGTFANSLKACSNSENTIKSDAKNHPNVLDLLCKGVYYTEIGEKECTVVDTLTNLRASSPKQNDTLALASTQATVQHRSRKRAGSHSSATSSKSVGTNNSCLSGNTTCSDRSNTSTDTHANLHAFKRTKLSPYDLHVHDALHNSLSNMTNVCNNPMYGVAQFPNYHTLNNHRQMDQLSHDGSHNNDMHDSALHMHAAVANLGKQKRTKWTSKDLYALWESISIHGNEWQKVKRNFSNRTYHQVKDKGKRLLHEKGWETGRSKSDNDKACDQAKAIAQTILESYNMGFKSSIETTGFAHLARQVVGASNNGVTETVPATSTV